MDVIKPAVQCYTNKQSLSEDLTERILQLILEARSEGRIFNVALSGGSTPKQVFEYISTSYQDPENWKHVRFYWVDERCVPPDHADSNFRMTEKALLKPLNLSEDQIHRMMGETMPEEEARRYEALLRDQLPGEHEWPVFDLVLLGMGADGHTASIFPDQMHLLNHVRCCETALHPESGQQRITLTGNVINRSRQVYFLVTGRQKSELVRQIIHEAPGSDQWPAAHIRPLSGNLTWFLDAEAAEGLDCVGKTQGTASR